MSQIKTLLVALAIGLAVACGLALGIHLSPTKQTTTSAVILNKAIAELATRKIVWRLVDYRLDWMQDHVLDVIYTVKVGYDFEEISKTRAVDEEHKIVSYTLPDPMIISLDDKLCRNYSEQKSVIARLLPSGNPPQQNQDLIEIMMLAQDCERYNLFALDLLTEKIQSVLELLEPGYKVNLIKRGKPDVREMFKRYIMTKTAFPFSLDKSSTRPEQTRP